MTGRHHAVDTVGVTATPGGFLIRQVSFRDGSDADLAALHVVDTEVQRERRPDLPAQPFDKYLQFARGFPAHITEWTWLVTDGGGRPAASASCWYRDGRDPTVLEADVTVRDSHRRRGLGSALLSRIVSVAEGEDRRLVVGPTLDTVPAGAAFADSTGAKAAQVNRTSALRLDVVDWELVRRWIDDGPHRAPGYRLEFIDGPYPPDRYDHAIRFHDIMQTAPRDDLPIAEATTNASHVAEWDALLAESGATRWTLLVVDPDGVCVGGTEVQFEPWDPATAHQGDTGIDPQHRGRGLGKWVKAAMLERIRAQRPTANRVRTGNAYSNAPMLAINDRLGFEIIYSRTEWVLPVPNAAASRSTA